MNIHDPKGDTAYMGIKTGLKKGVQSFAVNLWTRNEGFLDALGLSNLHLQDT